MNPEDKKISEAYAAVLLAQAKPKKRVLPTPPLAGKKEAKSPDFVVGEVVDDSGDGEIRKHVSDTHSEGETELVRKRSARPDGIGFLVSIALHIVLILAAIFVVVKEVVVVEPEPEAFVTGSGGGGGGESAGSRRFRPMKEKLPKIVSKSAHAKIVLPEMNVKIPELRSSFSGNAADGLFGSGSGGGFGGGSGGGIGTGKGIGIGNGKNFIGKFQPREVMGAKILAEKVAVYLDCSGSMLPYLPSVRREIYDKYPDADIFEFDGIRTYVFDGEVIGGRNGRAAKKAGVTAYRGIQLDGTNSDKLSREGKRIYKRYKENFEQGSVGAWIDVMLDEKYDALVVFSDFYDGLRQYDKDGETIFADSNYHPMRDDKRKGRDLRWETRWQSTLKKRKNALRIYLFSIGIEPQQFLLDCVETSGGETADVSYLRDEVKEEDDWGTTSRSKRKSSRSRPESDESLEEDDSDDE